MVGEARAPRPARRRARAGVAKNFSGRPMPAKAKARRPAPVHAGRQRRERAVERRQRRRLRPVARGTAPAPPASPIARSRSARASPAADRLAQRPGRHHPAVAEAEAGVDHDDRAGPWRAPGSAARRPSPPPPPRPPPRRARRRRGRGRPRPARRRRAAAARRRPRPRVCRRSSTRTGPSRLPPCPRETTCAATPRARSRSTSAITVGVLPAPPAVRLPTQITGTASRTGAPRASRRRAARAQSQARGASSRARSPGRAGGLAQKPRRAHQRLPSSRSPIASSTASVTSAPSLQAAQARGGHLRGAVGRHRRDQRLGELGLRAHQHRRVGVRQPPVAVDEVAHVRAVQDGAAEQRRLERVVPADVDQAAADEADRGDAVPEPHLAQRVGEIDVGVRRRSARPWSAAPPAGRARAASRPSRRRAPDAAARGSAPASAAPGGRGHGRRARSPPRRDGSRRRARPAARPARGRCAPARPRRRARAPRPPSASPRRSAASGSAPSAVSCSPASASWARMRSKRPSSARGHAAHRPPAPEAPRSRCGR